LSTLPVETKRIYGFTGTSTGMTSIQKEIFNDYVLLHVNDDDQFHHGDCIGADAQAHYMALDAGYQIHVHPCTLRHMRAFCKGGHVTYLEIPPLKRNIVIVKMCDELIATPYGVEIPRSGTWHTVRNARLQKKPIHIIYPDGHIVHENV
jgi:hypothetical protein